MRILFLAILFAVSTTIIAQVGTWSVIPSITSSTVPARYGSFSFVIGDKAYVGGGEVLTAGNYTDEFWEYNMTTGVWRQRKNFPLKILFAVGFSIGDKGYAGTGNTSAGYEDRFYVYDTTLNNWSQITTPFPGGQRTFATGAAVGGKGYVGTGYGPGTIWHKDWYSYSPVSGWSTALTPLPGPARQSASSFVIGNKVYVACGLNSSTVYNDIYAYDVIGTSWSTVTLTIPGLSARRDGVAFSIGNYGYIGSGHDGSTELQDFMRYNPLTGWSSVATLTANPRSSAVAFSGLGSGYVGLGNNGTTAYLPDFHKLIVCTPFTFSFTSNNSSCNGNNDGSLNVTAGGGNSPYTYAWSSAAGSQTTQTASNLLPGNYSVVVTDVNGCSYSASASVVAMPIPTPTICMVTVDSISKNNVILWDKDQYLGADSFFVYRELGGNNYQIVGKQKRSTAVFGEFQDTVRSKYAANGDPNAAVWRYKIAIKDTCGNLSSKSLYHQTMRITHVGGGTFNWPHYEIEGQPTPVPSLTNYQFRRDNNATGNWTNLTPLVPSNSPNFTDANYALYSATADWRVETIWSTQCNSSYFKTTGAIKRAKSNVSNNKLIGIKENALEGKIKVFPNPAKEIITIDANFLNENYSVTIQNSLGQIVLIAPKNFGTSSVNMSKLASGFYTVVITTETGSLNKKLVVE